MTFVNNVDIFGSVIARKEISSWVYNKALRKCLPIGFIRDAGA